MHFPDCLTEPRFTDLARNQQSRARTMLGVPLLRGGDAIGVIFLARTVVRPFTDRQIALVTTFANQAVIAIENARLFEVEQASKRELTEALEHQTATADVLKVISRSALDLQRVLNALVESAARLCNAYDAVISQVFVDGLRFVAHHGQIPTAGPVGQLALRVPSSTGEQSTSPTSWRKRTNTPRAGSMRSNSVIAVRSPSLWSTQARRLG